MEIIVNLVYDNRKLLEKLIKDRARFWGVELDYETYNFIRHEVMEMYCRKEEHRDREMRKLWSIDELVWLDSLRQERLIAQQRINRGKALLRRLFRKEL